MSAGELLEIDPAELKFPFELRKQISCSLQLSNKTDDHIAFKVKTTNPKKYCVRQVQNKDGHGDFFKMKVGESGEEIS